ncbi:MAG: L,D-transpeptidase family protein [Bacillota bacterium]
MKKAIMILAAVVVLAAVSAGVATIIYTASDDYRSESLPDGMTINGVDCSGLTYDEAEAVLTETRNSGHLQVVGELGETLADYTDFGCTYDIRDELKSVKKDHLFEAAMGHYFHLPLSARIAMNVGECSDDFADRVKNTEFLHREGVTETQDAYVDMDDPDFPVVPEVYGNKTDEDAYLKDILHAISLGDTRFVYDEKAYITMPEVRSDDADLLKFQKYCRDYLGQKITYELGDETFTLSSKELDNLMKDDYSGEADPVKVSEFAKALKAEYDIVGSDREFTSFTGKTFQVDGGDYGWIVDEEGEAKQLEEDINSHKDVDREPVFSQKGNGAYSRTLEVGDTYIDVDLTEQHVYYFENGKQKFDCDCVSGCVAAGHSTPTGVYDIKGKSRNVTLKGGGKKKSKTYYESFVSYWMPFLGASYGLHDATWRSHFGGDIYKYSGSHGCVNLPPSKTPELYNMISVGTIVVIHK